MSHLGDYFRKRRHEKGLSLGQIVRLLGYRNVNKGCNRVKAFEDGDKITPDLLGRLAEVLTVGPDEIRQQVYEEHKQWSAWANEPIQPYVVVRLLAAVYQRVEPPVDPLGLDRAEAFASNLARERRFKVCLVLSRRLSVWFDAGGHEYARTEATPELPCEPFVMIGGRRVQFDFDGGMGMRSIDGL